jgi:hypothetical protein
VTLKPSPGRGGLVRDSAVINQLSLGGLAVGPSSADSEDSEAARSRVTQQCMSLLESYRGGNPKERDEAHSTATEGVVSYKPSFAPHVGANLNAGYSMHWCLKNTCRKCPENQH